MIPIQNYEQEYAIDPTGLVTNIRKNKPVKPSLNKQNGYWYVALWKNNKGKTFSVHRLVAIHFIPNPDNKPEVNHKNSNRQDCHQNNLEWVTRSENSLHGYRYGFNTKESERNFTDTQLKEFLIDVLNGKNITQLAKEKQCGLSRLSINLKRIAEQENKLEEYLGVLKHQKLKRAQAVVHIKHRIAMCDSNGHTLQEFDSLHAATKALGKSSSGSISNALSRHRGQEKAYGYIWKYL